MSTKVKILLSMVFIFLISCNENEEDLSQEESSIHSPLSYLCERHKCSDFVDFHRTLWNQWQNGGEIYEHDSSGEVLAVCTFGPDRKYETQLTEKCEELSQK